MIRHTGLALAPLVLLISFNALSQDKSLEVIQQQLESMTNCQISLEHERCNLDILDQETAELLRTLDSFKNPSQSRQSSVNTNSGSGCFDSSIQSPSPFMGNNGEVFKLFDGTIGEVFAEYEYLYEYYPSVTICPAQSIMIIAGKKLNITIIAADSSLTHSSEDAETSDFIESRIDGDFEGYDFGNIYKLVNGQIWEQTGARYRYRYRYAPEVIIFKRNGSYQMQVDGIDDSVSVERLK